MQAVVNVEQIFQNSGRKPLHMLLRSFSYQKPRSKGAIVNDSDAKQDTTVSMNKRHVGAAN